MAVHIPFPFSLFPFPFPFSFLWPVNGLIHGVSANPSKSLGVSPNGREWQRVLVIRTIMDYYGLFCVIMVCWISQHEIPFTHLSLPSFSCPCPVHGLIHGVSGNPSKSLCVSPNGRGWKRVLVMQTIMDYYGLSWILGFLNMNVRSHTFVFPFVFSLPCP